VRRTAPEATLAIVAGRHGQPGRLPPGTRRQKLVVSSPFRSRLGKKTIAPPAIRNFDHQVSQWARFSGLALGEEKSGLVSHHLAGSCLQAPVHAPLIFEVDRPLVQLSLGPIRTSSLLVKILTEARFELLHKWHNELVWRDHRRLIWNRGPVHELFEKD